MPIRKPVVPKFPNEEAEAAWWYKNRRTVEADLVERLQAGEGMTLAEAMKCARAKQKAALQSVTIRIPAADLATARHLAKQRGLPYQTYIKMLLRDGLRRDFASQTKARR